MILGDAIVNLALSCTKKFKGNFHLPLKRKSYHHTKYIWHVVAISVICTAIGNVNIFLVSGIIIGRLQHNLIGVLQE